MDDRNITAFVAIRFFRMTSLEKGSIYTYTISRSGIIKIHISGHESTLTFAGRPVLLNMDVIIIDQSKFET